MNDVDLAGATAVFETSIDDYAEIWVDGELSRALGQSGGSVVKGWNAPNRLIVNRSGHPAQKIQFAVNYRGNTLSRHFDSPSIRTVLKAGDRAPDVTFCQRGKMITLFELLRPFRPLALSRFDGKTSSTQIDRLKTRLRTADINTYIIAERDSDSDPDCLIDIYGDFARLYGMRTDYFCPD